MKRAICISCNLYKGMLLFLESRQFVGARMQSAGMCKKVAGVEQRASRGFTMGPTMPINIVQCYDLRIWALIEDASVCR